MVGVVLYVVVDVVLQALPPHYSPVTEAESNLAVGPFGWIMNLNFLGRAVTTACAVAAISRTGPASSLRNGGCLLLAIAGVGSAVLAAVPTDVPGPNGVTTATVTGTVHLGVAGGSFAAALAGILVLTAWIRRSPQPIPESVASALALIACVGLIALVWCNIVPVGLLGLAERICLAGILGWTFVVCAAIRRLG